MQTLHHLDTNTTLTLQEADIQHHSPDFPNWNQALVFCREWNSGKAVFSINTSGSTGTPKTIQITRNQMKASAKNTVEALQLKPNDNVLIGLNTAFIAGQMMLVRGIEHQMNVYVTEPSANPLSAVDASVKLDFTALVPLQLQAIIENGDAPLLNTMKAIIVGGAPVSPLLQQQIEKLDVPVYATYGMTETVSHIALQRLNGVEKSNHYVAFDEVILGTDNRQCLTIRSSVTNNETIVTNDIVHLINNKQFEWLGRYDHVINSGGVKIHPEKVECQLTAIFSDLHLHNHYFIAALPDEKLGEKVILIIEGESFDTTQLGSALTASLSKYEVPKAIYWVSEFVKTSTDKLNRKQTLQLIG